LLLVFFVLVGIYVTDAYLTSAPHEGPQVAAGAAQSAAVHRHRADRNRHDASQASTEPALPIIHPLTVAAMQLLLSVAALWAYSAVGVRA